MYVFTGEEKNASLKKRNILIIVFQKKAENNACIYRNKRLLFALH